MSCGSRNVAGSSSGSCIRDIVRKIIDAQRKVAGVDAVTCITSCEQSIEELLSPSHDSRPSRHTTIPVMLFDGCGKAFVGSGFVRSEAGNRRSHLKCVDSPVFKVKGFAPNSNNCVRVEILLPVYAHGSGEGSGADDCHGSKGHGACKYFDNKPIRNFRETGLCITIDLDCFCGITCLDPITPIPVN